jgi:hypothetical protein
VPFFLIDPQRQSAGPGVSQGSGGCLLLTCC